MSRIDEFGTDRIRFRGAIGIDKTAASVFDP